MGYALKKGVGKKKPFSQRYFEARRKYPKACISCFGGGWIWDDSPRAGDFDIQACLKCLEKGKCPVCSGALPENYEDIVMDMDPDSPDLKCLNKKCKWIDGNIDVLPDIETEGI